MNQIRDDNDSPATASFDAANPSTMTPEQEHAFYADPDHQVPQGPPVRRRNAARLSDPVPVRFSLELLAAVRERATADDRSVSAWIRRAVEHELTRTS